MTPNFWQTKSLSEMNQAEWEALCDGCGKCCLQKLEDEESGEVYYTNIACRFLDIEKCRCKDYSKRTEIQPECMKLTRNEIEKFRCLPNTCAYRLLAEGKPLFAWHPLISGDAESVHRAGMSARARVISEDYIHPDQVEEHIVKWVSL